MAIHRFREINESHAATGYGGRTDLPAFHVFTLEDTYPATRKVMPPYSFDFYQVVLLEQSGDAMLTSKTDQITNLSNTVTFASPDHVLSWVRGDAQRGFIIYFKEEFLAHHVTRVQDAFPYFRLTEVNLLRSADSDRQRLHDHCARLLFTFNDRQPYRVPMLQALLLVLLYDCQGLYEAQQHSITHVSAQHALAFRFQQFVDQHFLSRKTVDDYAKLLHVSSDHLSDVIKEATGKTAHRLIVERLVVEAKTLLRYSDLSVAEIATYLGYANPAHFGRFFRTQLGVSPRAWRLQQHAFTPMRLPESDQFSP